ncbi:hypothetical protein L6R52_19315 [Myxococcota bacterium]|nr:hypothetical protein [Myxococcota bacterium]
MSFRFRVTATHHLPIARVHSVDGILEAGSVQAGATASIEGHEGRIVRVKSVALVHARRLEDQTLTLELESPDFPLDELRGVVLVGPP